MKLKEQTKVMIPWFDTDGVRQWSTLTFTGDVYMSKVRSEIRKFVKHNFNQDVDNDWLDNVPLVFNMHHNKVKPREDVLDKAVEEFIERMQYDETDDSAGSTSQEDTAGKAEEPLCLVQSVSRTHGA